MNSWIAPVTRLGVPLLIAGLTWAGDATAAPWLTVTAGTKQGSLVDANLSRSVLQLGSRGRDVESLQRALERYGVYTGPFDGIYSPETKDAVALYQSERSLSVTGVANSTTLQDMGFSLPATSVTAAPVTAAPVTAAPVTAAPVTAAPVTAAPVAIDAPPNPTPATFNSTRQSFEPNSSDSNPVSGSNTVSQIAAPVTAAPVAIDVPPNPTPATFSSARQSFEPNSSGSNPVSGSNTVSQNFESNVGALTRRQLSQGDTGPDVLALQRALNNYGYRIAVDGVYGQGTADAVQTYQRIQELPATGVADTDTLEDMGFDFVEPRVTAQSAGTASTPRTGELSRGQLQPGDTGADVVALQRALNSYGLNVGVDGDYGPSTTQAVQTYQRTRDLPVTGVADQDTLEDMGFEIPNLRYIAAVIGDEAQLAEVRRYFPDAYIDSNIEGEFINIGNFASREPAEARSFAARARDLEARVIYKRSGLF